MNEKIVKQTIEKLRKESKKRNFDQSFDLVITLRDMNLKNPNEQVDFFATCKHSLGKKIRIAALAGPELNEKAKKICDTVISQEDFAKYSDKKLIKKLADEHDFIIAQADIMPKVAQVFGRVLGPRGKMPNPKLGSILPGRANVEPLIEKLQKAVRVTVKKSPVIQIKVGSEAMTDEKLTDNIMFLYDQVIHHLPKEKGNIKNILLKLTMSKPISVEEEK